MREHLAQRLPERVGGIRLRGRDEVSRIEGFSDAVFGFSITLLIVSLEVPRDLDALLAAMAGFVPFAFGFWLLASVWHKQFRYFRAYGLQDDVTAWLNIALLFVVLFYTYPLKFSFSHAGDVAPERLWQLAVVYGAGWVAIYVIFVLLHAHALRSAEQLDLDGVERLATREHLAINAGLATLGAVSVGIALVAREHAGTLPFFVYFGVPLVIVPVKTVYGRLRRRRYGAAGAADAKAAMPAP